MRGGKYPDGSDQSSVRHGYQALSVKGPKLQKSCRDDNLKGRASNACCVRDQGEEATIRLASRNTQHDAGADLRSKPKINKPDLTAWR